MRAAAVSSIASGSQGEQRGHRVGDVLAAVDDQPVPALAEYVAQDRPGGAALGVDAERVDEGTFDRSPGLQRREVDKGRRRVRST